MADLSINIAGMQMKNPVMTASGTFGYGLEYADFQLCVQRPVIQSVIHFIRFIDT